MKLFYNCIPELYKLTYLNLAESLLNAKMMAGLLKLLPKSLHSLIFSGNPVVPSTPAQIRKQFIDSFKDYFGDTDTKLTLLDLSSCFLGFETVL